MNEIYTQGNMIPPTPPPHPHMFFFYLTVDKQQSREQCLLQTMCYSNPGWMNRAEVHSESHPVQLTVANVHCIS